MPSSILPGTLDWVLEGGPSLRFFALTRLLGAAPDAPEVQEARRAIMTEGPVPRILAEQQADGHWEGPDRFYRAKYRGTVWTLLILAELGADGADARVRAACEAVLRDAQDQDSGGFSYDRGKKAGGGLHSGVIPCLTGNLVFSLVRLGMLDDPRVQRAVDWITTCQRFDDAEGDAPTGRPYDRLEMCWGRHTCSMGAIKALKALAEIPPEHRTPAMHATISAGAEFFLRHHVHRRSHDLSRDSKPGWRRFGFPLMYQTDALEILLVLTRLGREGEVGGGGRRGRGRRRRHADPGRRAPARSAGPRRLPRRRSGPLEAPADLQQPVCGRHRDQRRAQPLGDAAGARGATSGPLAFHYSARNSSSGVPPEPTTRTRAEGLRVTKASRPRRSPARLRPLLTSIAVRPWASSTT